MYSATGQQRDFYKRGGFDTTPLGHFAASINLVRGLGEHYKFPQWDPHKELAHFNYFQAWKLYPVITF